ncbi:hypothetical protein FOCC_FOCC013312 [Frankliniella occidentalis]|nr:hypothetical protein FOCC_FOCC013312 [Frankliniella occidentalis]
MFRKEPLNPPVSMKPLYWTRIVVPVTVTITTPETPSNGGATVTPPPLWEQLEEAKIEDMDAFTSLFSRQVIERKPTKKKTEKPSKQQAIKILDSKRSQNIGILASSLHKDFSEIEHAIYNLDTTEVSLEALQQIYEVRASDEELQAIRAHVSNSPDIPLDKPEQFLYELAEIPNFAERIACFMFQSEFEDRINSIESKLNNIKSTSEQLMESKSLKTVLAIILALGNFMNGGNRTRGQADGFGLEILPKLRDVKSSDNSLTLLHFIVRSYMKKISDPVTEPLPVPEPADIDKAGTVMFDDLTTDLKKLEKQLQACETKTKRVILASSEENLQPFKEKMETFLLSASKRVQGEIDSLKECMDRFIHLLKFYQYQPKGTSNLAEVAPRDFFPLWSPFCSDFKDIWKKEQQRIAKEKMNATKKKVEKMQNVEKMRKQETGLKARLQKKIASTTPSLNPTPTQSPALSPNISPTHQPSSPSTSKSK